MDHQPADTVKVEEGQLPMDTVTLMDDHLGKMLDEIRDLDQEIAETEYAQLKRRRDYLRAEILGRLAVPDGVESDQTFLVNETHRVHVKRTTRGERTVDPGISTRLTITDASAG